MMKKIEEYLNKEIIVTIDHPIGSKENSIIYPINYGFTIIEEKLIKCYILGLFKPVKKYQGKCIAILHHSHEDKLIISDKDYSKENIATLIEFQEKNTTYEIIKKDIEFNSLIPELSVSNIKKSKEFYQKLGFQIVYERPQNKFCFLQLEKNQIMIEEINNNWQVGELNYPFGNGINISMSLSNIVDYYNKLKNNNISFFRPLKISEYEVAGQIYQDSEFLLQDPDGYLIRFND